MLKTTSMDQSSWGLSPATSRDLPRLALGNAGGKSASIDPKASGRPERAEHEPSASVSVACATPGPAAHEPSGEYPVAAADALIAPRRPVHQRRGAKPAVATPCPCDLCRLQPGHPEEGYHRDLRSLVKQLAEPQRRWLAALEARRLGFGGTRLVARITGLDEKTVRRGRRELEGAFADVPSRRLRRPAARRSASAMAPK